MLVNQTLMHFRLELALQITKGAAVWNLRGLCLSSLKRHDEALNNLSKARDLDKANKKGICSTQRE